MGETVDNDGGATYLAWLKAAVNADEPAELARWAHYWGSMSREIHDAAYDLNGLMEALEDVFDTPLATPAMRDKINQALAEFDDVGRRAGRNGDLMAQSGYAIADTQARMSRIDGSGPESIAHAQDVFDDLNEQNATLAAQLDVFGEEGGEYPGNPVGDEADWPSGTGSGGFGSDSSGGGGHFVPTTGPSMGSSPAGRFNPGPTIGGRAPGAVGKLGQGTGAASSGAGAGTGADGRGGVGGSARVGLPGAGSGMPIGGYRPAPGTLGPGGGATTPGGSAVGKPGVPGGPGRPGMVPPGGTGPGQPGEDRPGRRLTDYEKLEPNTFRDTRHRVKPVIGEQRRQPDEFKPTPGAISGKKTADETMKKPDLAMRRTPARIEGHDVSIDWRSRRAGPR